MCLPVVIFIKRVFFALDLKGEWKMRVPAVLNKTNKTTINVLFITFSSLFNTVFCSEGETAAGIKAYFKELHSEIVSLSKSKEMTLSIAAAAPQINRTFQKNEAIVSIIRTNSKGKVVNEIVRDGDAGQKFRDISNQAWYKKTAKMKPYYGNIKTRSGDFLLFWSMPIRIKKSRGGSRFGGAVAAKVDLNRCLKSFAETREAAFQVSKEGRKIFSHMWDNTIGSTTSEIEIIGIGELKIDVQTKAAPKSADALEKAGADSIVPGDVGGADPNKGKASVSGIGEKTKGGPEKSVKRRGNPWIMVMIFILAVTLIWTVSYFVKMAIKRRHEALLHSIEKEEDAFEHSPTVIVNRSMLPTAPSGEASEPESADRGHAGGDYEPKDPFVSDKTVIFRQTIPTHRDEPMQPRQDEQLPEEEMVKQPGTQPQMYDNNDIEGLYLQIRDELEHEYQQRFNAVINEKAEDIQRDAYTKARAFFIKSMKAYNDALSKEISNISKLITAKGINEQKRSDALKIITKNLLRIRDSLGRGGKKS